MAEATPAYGMSRPLHRVEKVVCGIKVCRNREEVSG